MGLFCLFQSVLIIKKIKFNIELNAFHEQLALKVLNLIYYKDRNLKFNIFLINQIVSMFQSIFRNLILKKTI